MRKIKNTIIKMLVLTMMSSMLGTGYVSAEAISGNLFTNGDFETGNVSPVDKSSNAILDLEISSDVVHSGNYALKIKNRNDESCQWGQKVFVSAGKEYIYSGYIKIADNASATSYPYSLYFNSVSSYFDASFESISGMTNETVSMGNGWQWVRFVRVVKATENGYAFPCLNVWKDGSSVPDYYADDIYFGELKVSDIRLGSFDTQIKIPSLGDTVSEELYALPLNQLGDMYGMENEKVTFSLLDDYEGVILNGNKIIVTSDAQPGEIKLKASVQPSFNNLSVFNKEFTISLLLPDERKDYGVVESYEKKDGKIRYNWAVIEQNKVDENLNAIAAVYGADEKILQNVQLKPLGNISNGTKDVTTEWMDMPSGSIFKSFLWKGQDTFGMTPVEADRETLDADVIYYYVSPKGDDAYDGTFSDPLKTLTAARDKIRALPQSERQKKIVVFLREGEYEETLTLSDSDSGNITYKSYPGETAVVKGSKTIKRSDLKKLQDESALSGVLAKIPESARENIYFVSLDDLGITYGDTPWYGRYSYTTENYINDLKINTTPNELFYENEALRIARYPNEGSINIGEVVNSGSVSSNLGIGDEWEPFTIKVNDSHLSRWSNAENAMLYGEWKYLWANQSVPLGSVDVNNGQITSKYPVAFGVQENNEFYIYNLIEELDAEGEYYIEDGNLYIYPPEGTGDFEFSNVTTPIIKLDYCDGVTFEDIKIKNTCSYAIKCSNVEDVTVRDCEIYNTANYAVKMTGENSGLLSCYIHDVDGGVELSGGNRETLTKSNLYVKNCEIENFSKLTKTYTPAVSPKGVGVIVKNNEIHGSEHLAIEWSGNKHIINYNEIYNVCTDTNDAGAIYSLRDPVSFGNSFKYNYIHDIGSSRNPGASVHGMYFDDGQANGNIYGNVFENISASGVHHAGRESKIENNIFVNTGRTVYYTYRDGTALKEKLPQWYNSEIWKKAFPGIENLEDCMTVDGWNKGHILKNNLIVNAPAMWCNDQRIEVDSGNEYITQTDPGFADWQNKDFGLKETSVVFEELPEFENIPFNSIGRKDIYIEPEDPDEPVEPEVPVSLELNKVYASKAGVQLDFNTDLSELSSDDIKAKIKLYNNKKETVAYEPTFSADDKIFLNTSDKMTADVMYQVVISEGFGTEDKKIDAELLKNFKIKTVHQTDFTDGDTFGDNGMSLYDSANAVWKMRDGKLYLKNANQTAINYNVVNNLEDYSVDFELEFYGTQYSRNIMLLMNRNCEGTTHSTSGYPENTMAMGYWNGTPNNYYGFPQNDSSVYRIAKIFTTQMSSKTYDETKRFDFTKGDGTITWSGKEFTKEGTTTTNSFIIDKLGTRARVTDVSNGTKTLKDDHDFVDYATTAGIDASVVNKTGKFTIAMSRTDNTNATVAISNLTVTTTEILPDDAFEELRLEKLYASKSGIQLDFSGYTETIAKETIANHITITDLNGSAVVYTAEVLNGSVYLDTAETLTPDVAYKLTITSGFGNGYKSLSKDIQKYFMVKTIHQTDFTDGDTFADNGMSLYDSTTAVYKMQDGKLYLKNANQTTINYNVVNNLEDYSVDFEIEFYGTQYSRNIMLLMNRNCDKTIHSTSGYPENTMAMGYWNGTPNNYYGFPQNDSSVYRIAKIFTTSMSSKTYDETKRFDFKKGDGTITWSGKEFTKEGTTTTNSFIIDKLGTRARVTDVSNGTKTLKDDHDFVDYATTAGIDASVVNNTGKFTIGMSRTDDPNATVAISNLTVTTTEILPDNMLDALEYKKLYASKSGVQLDFSGYMESITEDVVQNNITLETTDGTDVTYSADIVNGSIIITPADELELDKAYKLSISGDFGNGYSTLSAPVTEYFMVKTVYKTDFENNDNKLSLNFHKGQYAMQDNRLYMRNVSQAILSIPQVITLEDYTVDFDMKLYGSNSHNISIFMNRTATFGLFSNKYNDMKDMAFGYTAGSRASWATKKTTEALSRATMNMKSSGSYPNFNFGGATLFDLTKGSSDITWIGSYDDTNYATVTDGSDAALRGYIIDKIGTRARITEIASGVSTIKDDYDFINEYTSTTGFDESEVNKTGYFQIMANCSDATSIGSLSFGDFTVTTTEFIDADKIYVEDSLSYNDQDVSINLEFTGYNNTVSVEDVNKANFVLTGEDGNAVDYTVSAVVENDVVIGAEIKFKNSISGCDVYTLDVNAGANCKFNASYRIDKPISVENIVLKNSQGAVIDKVSDVTDGKLTVTADINNNTYVGGKAVNVITAVYNGDLLHEVKLSAQTITDTFDLSETIDIPTQGLTDAWRAEIFVWDVDVITPLVKKSEKTYGLDALKDTASDIKVAFIGGSITQGGNYTNPFIEKWQADRTGTITTINAGVGGTGSNYGSMRLYEDALSQNPDIVFVEFTLNDEGSNEASVKKNIESMIRQAYAAEHQPVISFIYIPDRRTEEDGTYTIANNVTYYDEVLGYYGLEGLNAHQLVVDAVNAETSVWDDFVADNNVHPNATQGEKIADLMYNEFKSNNYETYVKNIKWNPVKGFNAQDCNKPGPVSLLNGNYDPWWSDVKLDDVVTEGYGVPTTMPFDNFMATSKSGATMTYDFSGTSLVLTSLYGKNGRTAYYTISNSEGIVEKTGTLTNYIKGYDWYENVMLIIDNLEDTEHTLKITVQNGDGLFGIGEIWVDE